jgi:hypothetical protein
MCVHSTQRISLKKCYPTLRISSHFVQRYTLPTGGNRKATCQSCVKNYLPELPDDYLSEHCNNIFYELLWVIPSDPPEETQEHFEDRM